MLADAIVFDNAGVSLFKPENSIACVMGGGPGRTRTCNQTVMSGRL
jgi:hypothetical protein